MAIILLVWTVFYTLILGDEGSEGDAPIGRGNAPENPADVVSDFLDGFSWLLGKVWGALTFDLPGAPWFIDITIAGVFWSIFCIAFIRFLAGYNPFS